MNFDELGYSAEGMAAEGVGVCLTFGSHLPGGREPPTEEAFDARRAGLDVEALAVQLEVGTVFRCYSRQMVYGTVVLETWAELSVGEVGAGFRASYSEFDEVGAWFVAGGTVATVAALGGIRPTMERLAQLAQSFAIARLQGGLDA